MKSARDAAGMECDGGNMPEDEDLRARTLEGTGEVNTDVWANA